jgi:hypothetical protein
LIAPKQSDGSVNPLVKGLVSSLSDALKLTVDARNLHAFSMRAPSMIELYGGLWLEKNGPIFDSLDNREKELSARWFGEIENMKGMAKEIEEENFSGIIRNSVIVLADILENMFESFLHVCLEYYLPAGRSAYDFTGVRRRPSTYRDYRNDIRRWERSFVDKSRMKRLVGMVKSFSPITNLMMDVQYCLMNW